MSSEFQSPITIKDAIDNIHTRQFLLPAIQRKFTWSSNQIEMLFDSIMPVSYTHLTLPTN